MVVVAVLVIYPLSVGPVAFVIITTGENNHVSKIAGRFEGAPSRRAAYLNGQP